MNDTQKLIALIALSEQTFEENYYAWYRTIFRHYPFRIIYNLFRNKRRIL
jgi:hypothetical protein